MNCEAPNSGGATYVDRIDNVKTLLIKRLERIATIANGTFNTDELLRLTMIEEKTLETLEILRNRF